MYYTKNNISNLNEFVAYMPTNIIVDLSENYLPLEEHFTSVSEAVETLQELSKRLTLSFRAPTTETYQRDGTKKITPAFMPTVSNTEAVISKTEKLIQRFVFENFDYRKIYAKVNSNPNAEKFDEAINKLFALQTEEERKKISHWIWSASRKLHNLSVKYPTMLIFYGQQGKGKSMIASKLASVLTGRSVPAMNIDHYLDGFSMRETESLPIMFFDEFGTRDKKNLNKLKSMITDSFERIEYKGQDAFTLPSFKSFILTTNDDPKLLTQDVADRRYAVVEYVNTEKYLTLEEIDSLVQTLWETVPYNCDSYIDEKALYQNLISKSTNETMIDVLSNWFYQVDDSGINTLSSVMSHSSISIMELVNITQCSRNWAHKVLESPYFERVSPTSRFYRPNQELFSKVYNSLLNKTDFEQVEIEEKKDSKDLIIEAQAKEIEALKAKIAELEGNKPTPPTDPTPKNDKGDDCFTEEDIRRFGCLVKDTTYSTPSVHINENTQFIITATPKKEYMQKVINGEEVVDAKGEHHLPVFFTFESDNLSLDEQYEKATEVINGKYGDSVFSITNSGHKSIHTLVYIDPEQREEIAKDFKYYWNEAGKMLYGSTDNLDSACASIARLSRLPGGKRDDGSYQKCGYMNRECKPLDLSNVITKHKKEVEIMETLRNIQRANKPTWNVEIDEMKKLENIHNTGNRSESFELAYDVIKNGSCPSGANYVGAIASLKGMDFSEDFVKTNLYEVARHEHPSNITKSFETYWK